jgi:cardiolipin synthase
LKTTALSGIDVKIIIPAHPDHPFVFAASISYISELLEAGVKCYKYEKGFIHSKFITIDDKITSIGTTNMDIRSLKLNFEVNAFIYDEMITRNFNESFKKDLGDCTEITRKWYEERGKLFKIQESVSRLISPLL